MPFAERTEVPVARSRDELQRLLEKAGISAFGFQQATGGRARLTFELDGLLCAFELPELKPEEVEKKAPRTPLDVALAAEDRRRWRALLLVTKAKLEAIASGISTLEQEFMANVVLRNGRTLGAQVLPRLSELAKSQDGPRLLEETCS